MFVWLKAHQENPDVKEIPWVIGVRQIWSDGESNTLVKYHT